MLNMQKETIMSTEYTVPEPAVDAAQEPELPVFNNGITPPNAPPPPVVEGIPPRDPLPMTDAERTAGTFHMNIDHETTYKSPVEAVAGVGGIAGVQAEES